MAQRLQFEWQLCNLQFWRPGYAAAFDSRRKVRHRNEEETCGGLSAVPWRPFSTLTFYCFPSDWVQYSEKMRVLKCAVACVYWALLPDMLIAGFHLRQMCVWLRRSQSQCFGKCDWSCRESILSLYLKLQCGTFVPLPFWHWEYYILYKSCFSTFFVWLALNASLPVRQRRNVTTDTRHHNFGRVFPGSDRLKTLCKILWRGLNVTDFSYT